MQNNPAELSLEELCHRQDILTEPGYRFVNGDIAMVYSVAHYSRRLPLDFGQPYRLREYRIARYTQGEATYAINLMEYEVRRGDILLLLPGDIVELRRLSADCDFQLIAPSEQLAVLLPAFHNHNQPQGACLHLDAASWEYVGRYFELLWMSLFRVPYCREGVNQLLASLLYVLGSSYREQCEKAVARLPRQEEVFRNFLALVNKHVRSERAIGFYADRLFLSPHYLSFLIRRASGKTVMDWINRAVILEAQVLLKHSDMLVCQVSDELNFPNPSFFSKFFKRMTGMAPGEYRGSCP